MIRILFTIALLTSQTAFATTQVVGIISSTGQKFWIHLLDNSTESGPYESAELFDLLNVPVTQPNPYMSPSKKIANTSFDLECSVPQKMEPSGKKFGSCAFNLYAGTDTKFIKDGSSATYQITGDAAKALFQKFKANASGGEKFYWLMQGKQIEIEADAHSFQFRYLKK